MYILSMNHWLKLSSVRNYLADVLFFWPSSSSNEVPSEKDYENDTTSICITKTAVVCKRPDQRRIHREAHSALLSLSLST